MLILKYTSWLILVMAIVFLVHIGVLYYMNLELFENRIIWAYLINVVAALGIIIGLVRAPQRYQDSLGFLFMGGSFVKFALFFIFFYPLYKEDGEMSRQEFSTFFIPYAACLIYETKALVHKLSQQDKKSA